MRWNNLGVVIFVAFVCAGEPSAAAPKLVYGTYIGGRNKECATGLAVDRAGHAYIVGRTPSQDFPVTAGAFTTATSVNNDDWTGFVSKLNDSGSRLLYSSFVGGSFRSSANAVTVDANERAFVVGSTCSSTLPSTASAVRRTPPGGVSMDGCDGFLVWFNSAGSAVEYGTYLGGRKSDAVMAVALSADGRTVSVAGYTESSDFPVTTGAIQPRLNGGRDGFLLVLEVGSGRLIYSTYLGGAGDEQVTSVKIHSDGIVILGGTTSSPKWSGVPFRRFGKPGGRDAFVLRVDTTGNVPASGVRIGGSNDDVLSALDLDSAGNVYAVGSTVSRDFPQIAAAGKEFGGSQSNGFVVKFKMGNHTPSHWQVAWSRLLGGNGDDALLSVSAGLPGFLFVSGRSGSTNFPVAQTLSISTFRPRTIRRSCNFAQRTVRLCSALFLEVRVSRAPVGITMKLLA